MTCQHLHHNIPFKRTALAVGHSDCVLRFTIFCRLGTVNHWSCEDLGTENVRIR